MEKVSFGKIANVTKRNGWIFGHFQDDDRFKTDSFEFQFATLEKGQRKIDENGLPVLVKNKVSKTFTILLKGKLKIIFPKESKEFILKEKWDFCYSQEGVSHTWEALDVCEVVSLRWSSIKGDQSLEFYQLK